MFGTYEASPFDSPLKNINVTAGTPQPAQSSQPAQASTTGQTATDVDGFAISQLNVPETNRKDPSSPSKPITATAIDSEDDEDGEVDISPNKSPAFISQTLKFWWVHLLALPISSLVTDGLANIYGFKVLKSGVSLPNHFSLLKNGLVNRHYPRSVVKNEVGFLKGGFKVRLQAVNDGNTAIAVKELNKVVTFVAKFFCSIFNFLFSSTVRFIYREREIDFVFEEQEPATDKLNITNVIPNSRIGFVGVCKQISKGEFDQNTKGNVFKGIVQVAAGVALTVTGLGFFI